MSTIVRSQPRSSRPFIRRSAPREELEVHRSPDARRGTSAAHLDARTALRSDGECFPQE